MSRKKSTKKHRKIAKSAENGLPKGGPRVSLERGFWLFLGSWAPLGDGGPQTSPQSPPDPSKPGFGEIWGTFFEDFGRILAHPESSEPCFLAILNDFFVDFRRFWGG